MLEKRRLSPDRPVFFMLVNSIKSNSEHTHEQTELKGIAVNLLIVYLGL